MSKRVFVVGEGAREHTLCWAISNSPHVSKVYCAPGNGGTSGSATNVPIGVTDISGLTDFAAGESFDLVVVGPEIPLSLGLADSLRSRGLLTYGPSQAAARIESSKQFAKQVMRDAGVPTAEGRSFDDFDAACEFVRSRPDPPVVKADGLAAGKGVTVPATHDEAIAALRTAMVERAFGDSGSLVVLEDRLSGQEVTITAICDGERFALLAPACDYKRALDDDKGPNTGGIGIYTPTKAVGSADLELMGDQIIAPTLARLADLGSPFVGTLYAGLMITDSGPSVIEFNCRFGDPESQVVLPMASVDLYELLSVAATGGLGADAGSLSKSGHAVGVVLTSGGYPQAYETGFRIDGLDQLDPETLVFHAGTLRDGEHLVTDGGRVMTIVRCEDTLRMARDKVYEQVGRVKFENMHYRRDIALREL